MRQSPTATALPGRPRARRARPGRSLDWGDPDEPWPALPAATRLRDPGRRAPAGVHGAGHPAVRGADLVVDHGRRPGRRPAGLGGDAGLHRRRRRRHPGAARGWTPPAGSSVGAAPRDHVASPRRRAQVGRDAPTSARRTDHPAPGLRAGLGAADRPGAPGRDSCPALVARVHPGTGRPAGRRAQPSAAGRASPRTATRRWSRCPPRRPDGVGRRVRGGAGLERVVAAGGRRRTASPTGSGSPAGVDDESSV